MHTYLLATYLSSMTDSFYQRTLLEDLPMCDAKLKFYNYPVESCV